MRVAARCVVAVLGLVVFLVAVGPASSADIPKDLKNGIKNKMKGYGTLYTRIDLPCKYGSHAYGTFKAPLVEVTPTGTNTEGELGGSFSGFHAESTYWGVGPNFPMKVEEIEFDEGEIEIELEGVGEADGSDTVVLFKDIRSMEDFEKAFDHVFATKPLQDENSDWSPEVRQAIAERRLIEGMTKRQAFAVVGAPERFEKNEQDGVATEVWFLRQDRGTKIGYWGAKSDQTGLPSQISFVDGKLTSIGAYGSGSGVNLDD